MYATAHPRIGARAATVLHTMSVTLALAGSLGSAVAAAAATRDPVLAAKLTTVMKDPR